VNHRQLGVDLFNEVWRLMESREEEAARCRQRARSSARKSWVPKIANISIRRS
jgi:hypothetical protein